MNTEIQSEAVNLWVSGMTYSAIGERFGFSRQRAQQLISPTHEEYAALRVRAKGLCETCGQPVENGHAHHVGRVTDRNNPNNLRYLCPSCHKRQHKRPAGPPKVQAPKPPKSVQERAPRAPKKRVYKPKPAAPRLEYSPEEVDAMVKENRFAKPENPRLLPIGSVVLVSFEDVEAPCVIRDKKTPFGRVDFLVEPVGGSGTQWVSSGRVLGVAR